MVQSHRSRLFVLAFQSGVSVAITAAEASGERLVLSMSVVFRYSSRVIVGLEPCANEGAEERHKENAREHQKILEGI